MSEEFLGGNQTTPEEQVNEAPIQQEQTEQPSSPQESNYFEVKYNKEPVRVSYDEAPDYIQKGMNYDKVSQRVSEYENQLNRVAQLSGYQTHDELLAALDDIEQQQQRQQYEQAGIDPDLLNQLIEQHPDVQFSKKQRADFEDQQKFNQQANELFKEFPELKVDQIQPEVFVMNKTQGVPLLDAYLRVNFKSLAQQKEQEAIQKLQQNQLTSPGSLSGGDVNHKTNISSMGKQDFGSLVERVLRGEVKTL